MIQHFLACASLALVAVAAAAQSYPSKPVTFVSPFGAGGDSDLSGRNLAQFAPRYLNNATIVVVNRVGASGSIGSQAVRTAAPDGYTLLLARIGSHAILPAMDTKAPYKWNEFTMLSVIELNPYVCVVKGDSPVRTMKELVEQMRREPGKLNFSTSGVGTVQNLGPQYFFTLAGLTKDHAVGIHYKSGGDVTTALLGGQVQFACNNLTTLLSHIKSGVMRAVMVTTPERLKDLPEVPTSRELGWPDMEKITGWTALVGPPGLPKDVTDRWADALSKLAKDPDWLSGNAKIGGIPSIRSGAETEKFMREQFDLYEKLATQLGIRQ